MKKVVIVVIVIVIGFITDQVRGQGFYVENQNVISAGKITPQIDGLLYYTFKNSKIGLSGWFLVSKDYSEAYFGPSYSPKKWLSFSIGIGLEQTSTPLRFAGSVWLGNKVCSLLVIYEKSKDGDYWFNILTNVNLTKSLGLGTITRRFLGVGPKIQLSLRSFQIWGAPTYDWRDQSWKGIVSIKRSF